MPQKLVCHSLGANPDTPNKCRKHFDSFHVNYATVEQESETSQFYAHQVESRNLTNVQITDFDNDNEQQTGWVLEIVNGKVQLLVNTNEESGEWDLEQYISAQTCLQLADMFGSVAQKLLEIEEAKKAEEVRIQEIIDSSKLPFGEAE